VPGRAAALPDDQPGAPRPLAAAEPASPWLQRPAAEAAALV